MSQGIFFRLVLAFALAFSCSIAQLHALAHAQSDLASAKQWDKAPLPLKHSTDQCLVVHGLDGTPPEIGTVFAAEEISLHVVVRVVVRSGESPAAAFQSRAPPPLS